MNLSIRTGFRTFIATTILLFLTYGNLVHAQNVNYKSIDNQMLRNIEKYRTPKQNQFYKFISKWNNPVCLVVPASLLAVGIINSDRQLRKKSLYGYESIASAQVITFSLKFAINRPRPAIRDSTFKSVTIAKNAAFPSGHTAEAFAMATAMSVAVPKWYVIVPSYAWASLVAYSRIYLGVHYPSDILGGAIVGSGSAYLMYKLNKWLQKNDKGNHPANEITGMFTGLGAAYILYHVNKWIQQGKRKKDLSASMM